MFDEFPRIKKQDNKFRCCQKGHHNTPCPWECSVHCFLLWIIVWFVTMGR